MIRPTTLVSAALALVVALRAGPAQSPSAIPHPRGYVAYRAPASPSSSPAIVVDGRIDEPAWANAPWTESFVDIEGDRKPRPRFETRVRMLWDDAYFYVAAELSEPHVWATLTEHDSVIFHDNDFEVFIDPNGDNHEYYEFEINALGTGWDLLLPKPYKDDGKAVNGWEIAGLRSAVRIDGTLNDARDTDRGWTVELALPWRALGELARRPSPPRDGDQWRVNFSRVEWPVEIADGRYRKIARAREDNWVWSPQHVVDMHRPETWGYVQFSVAAPGRAAFVPDRSWPARQWLNRVYYAQRDYRKAHGRWAASLQELGGTIQEGGPAGATGTAPPLANGTLTVAGSLFEASIELPAGGGSTDRWIIRQDALVWRESR